MEEFQTDGNNQQTRACPPDSLGTKRTSNMAGTADDSTKRRSISSGIIPFDILKASRTIRMLGTLSSGSSLSEV